MKTLGLRAPWRGERLDSGGARRAGADEGGMRGARKRARTQCEASQLKQRGTGSRVRESGGRPGGRIGSRPTGTGISRRLPDRRRTWGENVRTCALRCTVCKRIGPRVRACGRAFVRAIVRARVRAGRGRWGGPMQVWPFGYWAWPTTGRRGAATLAHLLHRPVWPMQQPPSRASHRRCSARAWACRASIEAPRSRRAAAPTR